MVVEETKDDAGGFDAFFFKYNAQWIDEVMALKTFKDKADKLTQLQTSCDESSL